MDRLTNAIIAFQLMLIQADKIVPNAIFDVGCERFHICTNVGGWKVTK